MKSNNYSLRLLFSTIFVFVLFPSIAQDQPSGFAGVSGKGLQTTTGGAAGETILITELSDFMRAVTKPEPVTVLLHGSFGSKDAFLQVDMASDKTIIGVGSHSELVNMELHIINEENIIIRNISIRDSFVRGDWDGKTQDNDAIQTDYSHHIWIDHCHFARGGDGLIDLRRGSDYITVSWTHLYDHNKAFGLGWTDSTEWHATIHHCWFQKLTQRNPSFDQGIGHLYNNYLLDILSYGNHARGNARVVIENSYFVNVRDPITYTGDAKLYIENNKYVRCNGDTDGNVTTKPYDPKSYYEYTLDPVEQVDSIVMAGAGPTPAVAEQYFTQEIASAIKYKIRPTIHGNGKILPEGTGFSPGETITLEAKPNPGFMFYRWGGEMEGLNSQVEITVDDDILVEAFFITDPDYVPLSFDDKKDDPSFYFDQINKRLFVSGNVDEDIQVEVYSLSGQKIISKRIDSRNQKEGIPINLSQSGIYVVRVQGTDWASSGRFFYK